MSDQVISKGAANRQRVIQLGLALLTGALGIWSALRIISALDADPFSRWPDYLILLFPGACLFAAWVLVYGAFRQSLPERRPAKPYAVGALTVSAGVANSINMALKQTTFAGRLEMFAFGLAITLLAVLWLRSHFNGQATEQPDAQSSGD